MFQNLQKMVNLSKKDGSDKLYLTNEVGYCNFVWDFSNFNETMTSDSAGIGKTKKEGILRALVYIQVSISGQALIFITRTAGANIWWFLDKPCNLLLIAFVFAQVVATVIGLVGLGGYPSDRNAVIGCGIGYAVFAWVFALIWHFPLDLIKFAVNAMLRKSSYDNIAFTQSVNAGHPSMRHSRVSSRTRSIRASKTV